MSLSAVALEPHGPHINRAVKGLEELPHSTRIPVEREW
jgi:hypothetical protein